MKHILEVPQLAEVQDQIGDISAYISEHRTQFAFGAGLLLGIAGARLFGGPKVVVVNHLLQGAPRG